MSFIDDYVAGRLLRKEAEEAKRQEEAAALAGAVIGAGVLACCAVVSVFSWIKGSRKRDTKIAG